MTWPRTDGWQAYTHALADLHRERDAAVRAVRAAQRADAARTDDLAELANRVSAQEQALVDLTAQVRATPSPGARAPVEVPPLHGAAADADLRARVNAADAALAEARHVAGLPQLLPDWSSQLARAAVVYAVLAVPSLLLTVFLSLAGVHDSGAALLWFAVIWPAVVVVGGGIVVGLVSQPRRTESPGPGASFLERRLSEYVRDRGRIRRYPLLGLALAWASWLIPGLLLDWLGSLWPG